MPSEFIASRRSPAVLPDQAVPAPTAAALPLWKPAAAVFAFLAYETALHAVAARPHAQLSGLLLGSAPFLLSALGFCLARLRGPRPGVLPLAALVLVTVGLWLLRAPLARHFGWTYYLQHAGANGALGYVFGRTLMAGREPLCSRFAAAVRGPLPAALQRYTRRVTMAWAVFFWLTALVSTALFAWLPFATWSTFANVCSPVLIALMFVVEAGCRRIALPGLADGGVLEAVRGYCATVQAEAQAKAKARTQAPGVTLDPAFGPGLDRANHGKAGPTP